MPRKRHNQEIGYCSERAVPRGGEVVLYDRNIATEMVATERWAIIYWLNGVKAGSGAFASEAKGKAAMRALGKGLDDWGILPAAPDENQAITEIVDKRLEVLGKGINAITVRDAFDQILHERFPAENIADHFDELLSAERAVVCGKGEDASVEYVPDNQVRLNTLKVVLERLYGKPSEGLKIEPDEIAGDDALRNALENSPVFRSAFLKKMQKMAETVEESDTNL